MTRLHVHIAIDDDSAGRIFFLRIYIREWLFASILYLPPEQAHEAKSSRSAAQRREAAHG